MARYKIVLFGNLGSGKTQLSHRIALKEGYDENALPTLGVEFSSRKIDDNNVLHLWDITGSYLYKRLYQTYYRDAVVGLLCIDLTKAIDEDQIKEDIRLFRNNCPNTPIILAGTKSDSAQEDIGALKKIKSNELLSNCIITSAKEKTGIDELYAEIIRHCQDLSESLWSRKAVSSSSVTIGAVAGGISAYGLFKTSKGMIPLHDFSAGASSWNREIRL